MENVPAVRNSTAFSKAMEIYKSAGYGLTQKVLDASYCGVPQTRKRFILIGHLNATDGFMEKYLDAGLSSKPMSMYYMHPRSYQRRAVFSIYEPSATIRGINRPIPSNYKPHPADKANIAEGVRALTSKERSFLQTFPEEFVFQGKPSDIELAIGNAVPVNLAEYVAKRIIEYMDVN